MRITLALQKQHLGRMFKYNWLARRHRVVPIDTSIVQRLQEQGIEVEEAKNVAYDIIPEPKVVPESKPLTYTLGDTNVLLEGLEQASVLLRTVIHSEQVSMLADLPETFVCKDEEVAIKRCIAYAHLYDAQQVKLPKRVNPERKMWNYRRDYGVSQRRKLYVVLLLPSLLICMFSTWEDLNELLIGGLFNKIESRFGPQSCNHRMLLIDGLCRTKLTKDGKPLQLENTVEYLWTSDKMLQPLCKSPSSDPVQFPDLHPVDCTVSLVQLEDVDQNLPEYPVSVDSKFAHPHTAISFYSPHWVKNLYAEPVTDSQYYARTLTKGFTVAASYAQQRYGPHVNELPEPIVVQSVQSDGKEYHFGILQLNSLDLDNGEPNHFWLSPERLPLYELCDYVKGKPVLSGYSSEVFDRLTALYTNGLQGKIVPHSYYESSVENIAS